MAPENYDLEFLTHEHMEKLEGRETERTTQTTTAKPTPVPSLPRPEEEELKKPWYLKILGR